MHAFIVCLVLINLLLSSGHEICLDSEAPKRVTPKLRFCRGFSEYGCCTRKSDSLIKRKYMSWRNTVPRREWQKCAKDVKNLLCQECSPYSGDFINGENPLTLPILCPEFCNKVYKRCKIVYQRLERYLVKKIDITKSNTTFCSYFKAKSTQTCYPETSKSHLMPVEKEVQAGTAEVITPEIEPSSATEQPTSSTGRSKFETEIVSSECICFERFQQQYDSPTDIRHAGNRSGRLYVSESRGVIYVVNDNGKGETHSFFDISNRTMVSQSSTSNGAQQGLLAFVFHPNYQINGKMYVLYVGKSNGKPFLLLSEFPMNGNGNQMKTEQSERTLLSIPVQESYHRGGDVSKQLY